VARYCYAWPADILAKHAESTVPIAKRLCADAQHQYWISVIHWAVMPRALGTNPKIRKRSSILRKMLLTELVEAMHGRILGFNVSVAQAWADQHYQPQTAGKPMPVEDSYIAAIAPRECKFRT